MNTDPNVSLFKYKQGKDRQDGVVDAWTDYLFPPKLSSLANSIRSTLARSWSGIKWVRLRNFFREVNATTVLADDVGITFDPRLSTFLFVLRLLNRNYSVSLHHLLRTDEIAPDRFAIGLYVNGTEQVVEVDEWFPLAEDGKALFLFNVADGKTKGAVNVFPFVLFKAVAKVFGSFEQAMSLSAESLMRLMTVVPVRTIIDPSDIRSYLGEFRVIVTVEGGDACVVEEDEDKTLRGYFLARHDESAVAEISEEALARAPVGFGVMEIYGDFFRVSTVLRHVKDWHSAAVLTVQDTGRFVIEILQRDSSSFRKAFPGYAAARISLHRITSETPITRLEDLTAQDYVYLGGIYSLGDRSMPLDAQLDAGSYLIVAELDFPGQEVFDFALIVTGTSEFSVVKPERSLRATPSDVREKVLLNLCEGGGERELLIDDLEETYQLSRTVDELGYRVIVLRNNLESETLKVSFNIIDFDPDRCKLIHSRHDGVALKRSNTGELVVKSTITHHSHLLLAFKRNDPSIPYPQIEIFEIRTV